MYHLGSRESSHSVLVLYSHCRITAARYTDQRMRIITDFISGIKVVKMFTWESAFKKSISSVRRSVVNLF